jgi:hypothetical protein
VKKDQGKTSKPAKKVQDIPPRKLTSQQEGSVKGGGTKNPIKPTGGHGGRNLGF